MLRPRSSPSLGTEQRRWVRSESGPGIRGPSLYKHVQSKQELLRLLMIQTMQQLLELQRSALAGTDEPSVQLRRVVEAHVRYHATHRHEAFVGTREIDSLEEPSRTEVISLRGRYERTCAG